MPAWRLDETERQVNKYDVGASDGEELHFVGHVFLCDLDEPTQVDSSTAVIPAFHMGPPLQQSPCEVDAVGSAALDTHGLSARESRQIKSFVDDRRLERAAQERRRRISPTSEYTIHPAAREPEPQFPLWRYNCAGFVLYAYLEADIELVDESHAPEVSLEFLKGAFPDRRERLNRPKFRKEMGVDVGDRWPVIMAGYVVNSLNRSPEEIRLTPYKPRSGDEFFPARYEDVEEASTPPPEPKP